MATRSPRLLPLLACAVACAWAVLVITAPWLATTGQPGLTVSSAAYLVGGIVCHQRAERCFHLFGAQLPVCARCAALYLGGAAALAFGIGLPRFKRREPVASWASRYGWRPVLAAAALPMLASVAIEWSGVAAVSNAWRAAASLPAAWAAGALVAESLSFRVRL